MRAKSIEGNLQWPWKSDDRRRENNGPSKYFK